VYATYRERSHIFVLYIREAHPTDGRQSQANIREKILIEDPKTQESRDQVARDFAAQFKVSLPILVDSIDNKVEKAYAAIPDRIYVIDAQGRIAYKGGPGPRGFRVSEVPPVLDRLLGVSLASTAGVEEPRPQAGASGSAGPAVPPEMRDRASAMLRRLGVEDRDAREALKAFDRKMDAYGGVMEARRKLLEAAGREKGDVSKPMAGFREAQKKYAEAAAKIDRELDTAIGYSKKPSLEGALTAMGLLGAPPGPPLVGFMGMGGRPGGPARPGRGPDKPADR
jgi:hypothetical protein